MKNGWRWITPTWGRVGTGYVFSSKHSSPEKISDELETDIGKKNLNFRMVDFHPKVSEKPFKKNSCSIGMSQGFLEPLDAPGLSLTIISIKKLADILSKRENELDLDHINSLHKIDYFWWASFILSQYKNCYRSDTSFWKEQKNVDCPFYNELMNMLYNGGEDIQNYQFEMFFYTLAAKDINVNLNQSQTPHRLIEKETILVNHYDIIKNIRGE
jgi:tryptophan halogenase